MTTIDAKTLHRFNLAVSETLAERYQRSFRDRAEYEVHRAALVDRMKQRLAWDAYSDDWPLNARVVGQVDRGDYVIEKVIFESLPGLRVPALVYRPSRIPGRRPAVLNPYGHWPQDKWQPQLQARCISEAKLGYIALVYDPPCQGERSWMGGGHERHRPSCQLAGHTMLGLMFWETRRALDYLLTRDDVDPARIACTGASGGGLNTLYSAMLEDRIAVAAPCAYATNLAALVARDHAGCCAYLPNHALIGEVDDVYAAIAPRKLLILGGARDHELCPVQSQLADVASRTFSLYDPSLLVSFSDPDAAHDYSPAMRERFYAWCARWLDGRTDAGDRISEPPGVRDERVPNRDPRLIVFRDESDRGLPLAEVNRRIAADRRRYWAPPLERREDLPAYRRQLVAQLRELMGDFPVTPVPASVLSEATQTLPSHTVTRYVLRTEPALPIRVARFRRSTGTLPEGVVLLLDFESSPGTEECGWPIPPGRGAVGPASLPASQTPGGDGGHAETEFDVIAIEPRGTGAGTPPKEDADLYGMALAKPVLAGQVHDVRAVRRFVERHAAGTGVPMILHARGERACSVATYCALLDAYDHVVLDRPLAAWQRYLDRGVRPAYAAFLPLQLKVCDLPQMWAALAPVRLTVVDMRDVAGEALTLERRDAILEPVWAAYELAGQPDRFDCHE